jgi:hypothetical protein
VLKQGRVQRLVLCQKAGSPFEIDRVPERDCRDNQVQPAGSMALVLEGAIADFAESVETDGPSHQPALAAAKEVARRSSLLTRLRPYAPYSKPQMSLWPKSQPVSASPDQPCTVRYSNVRRDAGDR